MAPAERNELMALMALVARLAADRDIAVPFTEPDIDIVSNRGDES
jgi:hypothetical protein